VKWDVWERGIYQARGGMKKSAMASNLVLIKSEPKKEVDRSYRVEFSVDGLHIAYQFRIWNKSSNYMCFLVKENSGLVPQLKVGDLLSLKCYYTDAYFPSEYLETEIQHITKKDEGRFKGHYVVGLEILGCQDLARTH
jgi:hypothetical protein